MIYLLYIIIALGGLVLAGIAGGVAYLVLRARDGHRLEGDLRVLGRRTRAITGEVKRPALIVRVSGPRELVVDLAAVPTRDIARVRIALRAILPRLGDEQDLGDVADELTVRTILGAGVAVHVLTRLAAEHGIEVRDATTTPGGAG